MSVLEEREKEIIKKRLPPADEKRQISLLRRAHKAKSSATSTPSGPSAEAIKSAAENRRKDAESRKPKTFAGRMKAQNKAAVTKEQLDAYKKAGGTGGLGGLLNKANKLGSVASAIKDTRERNVKRVARKDAGVRSAALNREKDAKSRTKTTSRTTTTDARERQVKKDAENAARKRSAAENRKLDAKSRMKGPIRLTAKVGPKTDPTKTKTGDKGPSAADKAIYQSMKNKELGITIPSNLPTRKEKRVKNALNMYTDTAKGLVGLKGIEIASRMFKAVGGKTGLQKIVKQSVNPTDIPFLAQVANRTSGINRQFSNFINNIAKEAKKQTTTVKRQNTIKKKQAKKDAETTARKEEITRANQRRAKDALETGYRRGGSARTRKVASAHKGPKGFKGTF